MWQVGLGMIVLEDWGVKETRDILRGNEKSRLRKHASILDALKRELNVPSGTDDRLRHDIPISTPIFLLFRVSLSTLLLKVYLLTFSFLVLWILLMIR